MQQLVIIPGGFHPFHAGHLSLYNAARQAFPGADVYVAATNDTSARPFPFAVKEKLADLAGVEKGRFVQVQSPFRALEITSNYDPETTQLIFVRSSKDKNKPPQPGGVKKDGSPSYLQSLSQAGKNPLPMSKHGYMTYLPTIEFGPGMTSASEIRGSWPSLGKRAKEKLVHDLYPRTRSNAKLTDVVIGMLDLAINDKSSKVDENLYDDAEAEERFQRALAYVKHRAKQGRLVTRWDPKRRVYHNVPTTQLDRSDPDYEEEKKTTA
jgi:hypothetical protein